MSLEINITAEAIRNGVWHSRLSPKEIRIFGNPLAEYGASSIMLIDEGRYRASTRTLTVSPNHVRILNVGTNDDAFIIDANSKGALAVPSTPVAETPPEPGDLAFVRELETSSLPDDLKQAGKAILQEIRKNFPGFLNKERRHFYVQRPDNFWTVTIQPRKQMLHITLRGRPEHFEGVAQTISVHPDMPGYSTFKVGGSADVQDAIRLIRHSRRKKY